MPEEGSASASQTHSEKDSSVEPSLLVGKRIVIVEDEGVTQLQLRRSLTRMGLVVAGVANSGESGMKVVLRERPDLVLMDIRMPGELDGLEATRRILLEYRVCIIMLTAFAVEEYQTRAKEIGACGYLLKPVVSETLLSVLEQTYSNFHTP